MDPRNTFTHKHQLSFQSKGTKWSNTKNQEANRLINKTSSIDRKAWMETHLLITELTLTSAMSRRSGSQGVHQRCLRIASISRLTIKLRNRRIITVKAWTEEEKPIISKRYLRLRRKKILIAKWHFSQCWYSSKDHAKLPNTAQPISIQLHIPEEERWARKRRESNHRSRKCFQSTDPNRLPTKSLAVSFGKTQNVQILSNAKMLPPRSYSKRTAPKIRVLTLSRTRRRK